MCAFEYIRSWDIGEKTKIPLRFIFVFFVSLGLCFPFRSHFLSSFILLPDLNSSTLTPSKFIGFFFFFFKDFVNLIVFNLWVSSKFSNWIFLFIRVGLEVLKHFRNLCDFVYALFYFIIEYLSIGSFVTVLFCI